MALHLMNGEQNEHVITHEIRGFVASDVMGALNEAYALSKATKCRQFMYSLSLNPPQGKDVPISVFEQTLERVEKKLGLENQPRVVVFHEKYGRRHAHCVWSRINIDEMKAVNISHPKLKLNSIAKSLYIEHGWKMPEGFRDSRYKNPLNYTRAEWQQAARTGQSPKAIKALLQECWAASDSRKGFEHALKESGYYLAKGDRRGFVAVDIYGEVYSLTRQLRAKKKELEERLGKAEKLTSASKVKEKIKVQLSEIFNNFLKEQNKDHQKALKPLLKAKQKMTHQHRIDRAAQKSYQEKRWNEEELKRAACIRSGFKGLWDRLNGKYWKTRKRNEQETKSCLTRDQKEQEALISKQLSMRQNLQVQLNQLQLKHEKDRLQLIHNLSGMTINKAPKETHTPDFTNLKEKNVKPIHEELQSQHKDRSRPDIDVEPEI